jgi:hypothetical protein
MRPSEEQVTRRIDDARTPHPLFAPADPPTVVLPVQQNADPVPTVAHATPIREPLAELVAEMGAAIRERDGYAPRRSRDPLFWISVVVGLVLAGAALVAWLLLR